MTARYLHDFYTNSLADCKDHIAKLRVPDHILIITLGDKSQPQKLSWRTRGSRDKDRNQKKSRGATPLTPTQNLITDAMSSPLGQTIYLSGRARQISDSYPCFHKNGAKTTVDKTRPELS